jgi:hypothetical protein
LVIVTLPDDDSPAMFCAVGVVIIPEQPAVVSAVAKTVALSWCYALVVVSRDL